MRNWIMVLLLAGLPAAGSTISSVGVNNSTSANVAGVASEATGGTMGAMVITATYAGGTTQSCVYNSATGSCGVTGWFNLAFVTTLNNTHPAVDLLLGFWEVTNNKATDMTSLSINALAGGVVFDRCFVNAAGGGIVAQDNNNAGLTNECAPAGAGVGSPAMGSVGSDVGFSAEGVFTLASNSASATYSQLLSVGANAAVGDLYGVLTLGFASGFRAQNLPLVGLTPQSFKFQADTDLVTNGGNDPAVPEPGTWVLCMAGLGLLGWARRR